MKRKSFCDIWRNGLRGKRGPAPVVVLGYLIAHAGDERASLVGELGVLGRNDWGKAAGCVYHVWHEIVISGRGI